MSLAQRKATEYLSMLKQKRTDEITSMRTNLLARMKQEKSKPTPDQSTLQNLNWQLSLLGRELSVRKPADQKEPMEAISDDQELSVGGTTESPLKSKTLDELNTMLADTEKKLSEFKKFMEGAKPSDGGKAWNEKLKWINTKIVSIKTEIATRSAKAQDEAKKDVAKAEEKWMGVDKDMIIVGASVAVMGGAIGWGMGKSAWGIAGFVIIGAGVGAGIVYLTKREKPTRVAPNV